MSNSRSTNNFVQATPGSVLVMFLRQVPGAPDDNRSAKDAYR